jgi:hypothetical protein
MKTLATSFALLIAAVTFTACSTPTIDPAPATSRPVQTAKPDSIYPIGRVLEDDVMPVKPGRKKVETISEVPVSMVHNPNPGSTSDENPVMIRKPRKDAMVVNEIEALD